MFEYIILIPYRNREKHLEEFIRDVIPLFEKHMSSFKIVIIEQEQCTLFNRGKLLNIGFNEYKHLGNTFFNHDIDVIPTEKAIQEIYLTQPNRPVKGFTGLLNSSCNTLGGIIKFDKETFELCNGYPNNFWGWGVEDKALQNRAEFNNIPITKNITEKSTNLLEYFTIKNDINDRHQDYKFGMKTHFEYDWFKKLPREKPLQYINNSGVNKIEYILLERIQLHPYVELIKVKLSN